MPLIVKNVTKSKSHPLADACNKTFSAKLGLLNSIDLVLRKKPRDKMYPKAL